MLFECFTGAHISRNTGKLQKGGCPLTHGNNCNSSENQYLSSGEDDAFASPINMTHCLCACAQCNTCLSRDAISRWAVILILLLLSTCDWAGAGCGGGTRKQAPCEAGSTKAQLTGLWYNETLMCYDHRQWYNLWHPVFYQNLHVRNHRFDIL